jgi:hypothetical protein
MVPSNAEKMQVVATWCYRGPAFRNDEADALLAMMAENGRCDVLAYSTAHAPRAVLAGRVADYRRDRSRPRSRYCAGRCSNRSAVPHR